MKTLSFILIVLVSGAVAGLVHGAVNLAIVEPYLDEAINIENQSLFVSGEAEDTAEFWSSHESYRYWQKGGQVLAGVVLGMAMGSLFGIVFALSRHVLPGNGDVKRALVLAGIMWLVIFFIPFLKYPANPPATGDVGTADLRIMLYVLFVAISGFGAAGFYRIGKRTKRWSVAAGGYAALMVAAFVAMPANPDGVSAPASMIDGFRAASVLGVSSFWATVPLVLGTLWKRFRPDVRVDLRP